MTSALRRFPAEWEQHSATWISWPREESDWPGKFEPIRWVYAEIVRALADSGENIEIICGSQELEAEAQQCLSAHGVSKNNFRIHLLETNRGWLRDSAPTGVIASSGKLEWVQWCFNAWAKYDDFALDQKVPPLVGKISSASLVRALRPDNGKPLVLEGGSIETDGQGTLITTEECLLSDVQSRNPGLSRNDYEKAFQEYLGITKTIWLGNGCAGDDTHGHIDDISRFVSPGVVVTAYEENTSDDNHKPLHDNYVRLTKATDAQGKALRVVKIPMPAPVMFDDQRLPASYCNFYIANKAVLVPTFNDPNDRIALNILAELMPNRKVIGIHCLDLVLGLGTLHCLSQQQPA